MEATAEPQIAERGVTRRYGMKWQAHHDDASIELYCFANDLPEGLGRYQHLKNFIDLFWNLPFPGTFIWNDWSELLMREFCENNWVTVTGPGASWKTTSAALFVLVSWYASPNDTAVVCTSTTLDGLRRRIWREISKFYRLRPAFGNPVQSRNCIQFEKGIDEGGIYGTAVDSGEVNKAIGRISGFHVPNVIVVVDEMPYTPEAIVESCVNLRSGVKSFRFIGLGNADDQLDPHGRACEPKAGWDSITEDSERWETKRGICIHQDGLKSPNVLAGRNIYPGLISRDDIEDTKEIYGVDSPQFWQMRRGFWAPEGVQKTVLSMPMIVRARAQENAVFDLGFQGGAALDPAFEGGDRCILRIGKCGLMDGKKVMQLSETLTIKTTASLDDPIHFQIMRQVKDECEKRGILPYYFALDSTGEGGGLASIFQREWSREILCVEFGGRPTKRTVSQTNSKRADQEYDRRVTELWFNFRILLQNEQVKGLDVETATEFCRRWYEMKGPYVALETKAKMKERTRKSPDLADAAVVLSELFSQRDHLLPSKGDFPTAREGSAWGRFMQKRNIVTEYEPAIS